MTENLAWAAFFLTCFFGQVAWMHLEEELQHILGCKLGAAASIAAASLSYQKMWFPEGTGVFILGIFAWILGCYTDIIPHIGRRWHR